MKEEEGIKKNKMTEIDKLYREKKKKKMTAQGISRGVAKFEQFGKQRHITGI